MNDKMNEHLSEKTDDDVHLDAGLSTNRSGDRSGDSSDLREALEQTVTAKDFTAAAMRSLAENVSMRDDKVSFDLVRNLLDTVEAENHGTETDFRLETRDVSLAETKFTAANADAPASTDADADEEGLGRYRVLGHLGSGAAGQVFEVQDYNFDRKIAVKFLHPQAADRTDRMFDFINEAKLSASLEHPNILPIHDVNISDSGMLYFSMQKAQGKTLKALLDDAELEGHLAREIRDVADRVAIMIGVCEAISYAHSKHIAHQDIKPSNIMIGQYGEVVLVDWGTAAFLSEMNSGRSDLVGTPIYMSPEQARREMAGITSDIYCLGSTLFHILTFRFPTWADDIDTFWDLKKRGYINPLSAVEKRRIPRPLLSIALKAMKPEAADRYQSVQELIADLKRFQHGEKVLAHKDTLTDKFQRMYRHNKRAVWVSCVGLMGVLILAALLYLELMKSSSEWRLYAVENFNDVSMAEVADRWKLVGFRRYSRSTMAEQPLLASKSWFLDNGVLCYDSQGIAEETLNLTYRNPIPGDMRVEFEFTPAQDNLALRCFIAGPDRFQGYHIHSESTEDPFFYLTRGRKLKGESVGDWQLGALAESYPQLKFKAGVSNHYRFEREGNHIRFQIDGKMIFDVYDIDVLNGPGFQQFGIELPGGDAKLDNVVIYNRPLAQKVSPLAVADTYFRLGDYEQAKCYYETLVEAYPGTDVRAQSLYRLGRCYVEFGQNFKAVEIFKLFLQEFPDHELSDYVVYETGRSFAMQRDLVTAKTWFRKISPKSHENVRQMTLKAIIKYYLTPYKDLTGDNPHTLTEPEKVFSMDMLAYLAEIEKDWWHWENKLDVKLMSIHSAWMSVPFMYIRFGKFDHVVQHYNEQSRRFWPLREVFVILGQREKLIERFPGNRGMYRDLLLVQKKYDQLIELFKDDKSMMRGYWMRMEMYDKVEEHFADSRGVMAGVYLGRMDYQKIINDFKFDDTAYILACIGLGQMDELAYDDFPVDHRVVARAKYLNNQEDEVLNHFHVTRPVHVDALLSLLLKAMRRGDEAQKQALLERIKSRPFDYWLTNIKHGSLQQYVIPGFIEWLTHKDSAAYKQTVQSWADKPLHKQIVFFQSVAHSLCGDDASVDIEYQDSLTHKIIRAMRSELEQKPVTESVAFYQAVVDKTKPHQRNALSLFVEWRLEELRR